MLTNEGGQITFVSILSRLFWIEKRLMNNDDEGKASKIQNAYTFQVDVAATARSSSTYMRASAGTDGGVTSTQCDANWLDSLCRAGPVNRPAGCLQSRHRARDGITNIGYSIMTLRLPEQWRPITVPTPSRRSIRNNSLTITVIETLAGEETILGRPPAADYPLIDSRCMRSPRFKRS
jgi:hypothetical protein